MVSIKHKVTLKTKVAQEETPEAIESPKVTLKRKQPEASVVAEPKPAPTLPKTEPKQKPVSPTPPLGKKSNTGKVIGGLVAAAIIAGIFFFINNKEGEGGNDSNPTEAIAQNTNIKTRVMTHLQQKILMKMLLLKAKVVQKRLLLRIQTNLQQTQLLQLTMLRQLITWLQNNQQSRIPQLSQNLHSLNQQLLRRQSHLLPLHQHL